MTAGTSTRILDKLRAIFGTEDVLTQDQVVPYRLGDSVPLVALLPDDEGEVSKALAVAWEEGLGVVPWGAGVHQCLGEPPSGYDVALDLRRLRRILAYEPGDMTATVQAGIRLDEVQSHVGDHGQVFPLDPPLADEATVGGVLATNLSGPLRCRYGTARDLVLGVRVAHADGTITKGGSRVVKNATAYDITKLYIGSHGTLAVILEASLRLYPRPSVERAWWLTGVEIEAYQELAARLLGSHLAPHRVEILDRGGAEECACPSNGPALLVSFAGVAEAVQDQGASLTRMAEASGMRASGIVDPAQVFRHLRDFALGSSLSATPGCRATLRGSVLPSDCAKAASALQEALGGSVQVGTVITASHGVLRCEARAASENLLIDGLAAARQALESLGGFLVLLETSRSIRAAVGAWGPAPVGIHRMRQLKDAFDPKHILNPSRFVGGI